MSEYVISEVSKGDRATLQKVDRLLSGVGIKRDANLDYICAMYDDEYNVIGTGSCFGNTLRCFAVDQGHQGEGILNSILSHLVEVQYQRGNMHLFLYTKIASSGFFGDLGFHEIARVDGMLVFMENRRDGFPNYLNGLERETREALNDRRSEGGNAAIVMNANPFTFGHQFLVETAAASCGLLHLFVVSEDASLVPMAVRKRLVAEGTAHIPGVVLHESGPYMISNATFPSYFLRDEEEVIEGHARLDIAVFGKIANRLGITARFAGEEPSSKVTGIYNRIMSRELPATGVRFEEIPRKTVNGSYISASKVRKYLQEENWDELRGQVPETTLRYFRSPEAVPLLQRIKNAGDVAHY